MGLTTDGANGCAVADTGLRLRAVGYAADRDWAPLVGYALYVAALAGGYYYNLTFVQLGLVDLGTGQVGLSGAGAAGAMAVLAIVALVASVTTGVVLDHRGWGRRLRPKLAILAVVAAGLLVLTAVAPALSAPVPFLAWVVASAIGIGAGIPVAFALMSDLIPVRDRGFAAALAAGAAFAVAALYPVQWRVEEFSAVMSAAMAPAVVVLALLASGRVRPLAVLVDRLEGRHEQFGAGRFARPHSARPGAPRLTRWTFALVVGALFGVFFIDSLGFLRIIDAPVYISTSWQSDDPSVRLLIAGAHVVGAAVAGVLYTAFDWRWLLVWVFGLFALTHLLYTYDLRFSAGDVPPLALPLFYVLAVSFYTTLNFALWPDLSTPDTVGRTCGVGVGVAGWLASFLSTALALWSASAGVPLLDHVRYVDALALLLLVAVPVTLYLGRVVALARRGPV